MMLFAPVLRYNDSSFTGMNITFGHTIYSLDLFGISGAVSGKLPLNMYAFVAFFAPIVGGLFSVIFKKGQVLSLALFVVAAAMFFLIDQYVVIEYRLAGQTFEQDVDWQHAYGLIIAGFASILAAIGEMLYISISDKS